MSSNDAFAKPRALGSKSRSFIPMTPRNVRVNPSDFQRHVAEHTSYDNADGQPPRKRFRSNAAPKGSRLASGYIDRAQARLKELDSEDAAEDKQKRFKALEEMFKLQQIDQETFEKLRDEIGVGGEFGSTHLVKGLDFKLLERVRRGEDVSKATAESEEKADDEEPEADVEDELEKAFERNVTAAQSKEQEPEDDVPTQSVETTTLSRDELLRRLKQQRKSPNLSSDTPQNSEPAQSTIDQSRFRKIETVKKFKKHKFTESINGRRREVLVITNKDGTTKRKTRWIDPEPDPAKLTKSQRQKVDNAWGGDLPEEVLARQKAAAEEAARKQAEEDEEEDDIFGGVADYDPLAGINSDEEDDPKKMENAVKKLEVGEGAIKDKTMPTAEESKIATSKPLKSTSASTARNYFNTQDSETGDSTDKAAILSALKRAAQLRQQEQPDVDVDPNINSTTSDQSTESQDKSRALLAKLQAQSRGDDYDVLGGLRDEEEEGEDDVVGKQKLSEWKGTGGQEDDKEEERGGKKGAAAGEKRKKGGKKKKGDKNSFADVMSVIEGRKKV